MTSAALSSVSRVLSFIFVSRPSDGCTSDGATTKSVPERAPLDDVGQRARTVTPKPDMMQAPGLNLARCIRFALGRRISRPPLPPKHTPPRLPFSTVSTHHRIVLS